MGRKRSKEKSKKVNVEIPPSYKIMHAQREMYFDQIETYSKIKTSYGKTDKNISENNYFLTQLLDRMQHMDQNDSLFYFFLTKNVNDLKRPYVGMINQFNNSVNIQVRNMMLKKFKYMQNGDSFIYFFIANHPSTKDVRFTNAVEEMKGFIINKIDSIKRLYTEKVNEQTNLAISELKKKIYSLKGMVDFFFLGSNEVKKRLKQEFINRCVYIPSVRTLKSKSSRKAAVTGLQMPIELPTRKTDPKSTKKHTQNKLKIEDTDDDKTFDGDSSDFNAGGDRIRVAAKVKPLRKNNLARKAQKSGSRFVNSKVTSGIAEPKKKKDILSHFNLSDQIKEKIRSLPRKNGFVPYLDLLKIMQDEKRYTKNKNKLQENSTTEQIATTSIRKNEEKNTTKIVASTSTSTLLQEQSMPVKTKLNQSIATNTITLQKVDVSSMHDLSISEKSTENEDIKLRNAKKALEFNEMANILVEKGKLKKAILFYTKAIDLNSQPIYYVNRAVNYLKIKEFSKALKDSKNALKLDPHNETLKTWKKFILKFIK